VRYQTALRLDKHVRKVDSETKKYYAYPILYFLFFFLKSNVTVAVQHSSQELRLISTPRLHALLRFHLVPINLIIFEET